MDFLKYISLIKDNSSGTYIIRGRKCEKINDMYVSFFIDDKGNYLNGLQFICKNDFGWSYSEPKEFALLYLNSKLNFKEHSVRFYGEDKLSKPKELKGIKQAFSVNYIENKARCQVFIKGNDVWIKHIDYFSPSLEVEPEDIGAPLKVLCDKYTDKNSRKRKFVYDDSWGDIVLRNEAWLCIENLMLQRKLMHPTDILNQILSQQEEKSIFKFDELELQDTYMSRFFENLLNNINELK